MDPVEIISIFFEMHYFPQNVQSSFQVIFWPVWLCLGMQDSLFHIFFSACIKPVF